jgi:holo-[acyl-carrier protein] synthase
MAKISGIRDMGIGTDIVSINRFKALDRHHHQSFLDSIFTEQELEYCFAKGVPAIHLAARFAGKEAVVKALTCINVVNISYKEIEIILNNNSVPEVNLNKSGLDNLRTYLSLSHCEDKALAFVIINVLNHECD